MMRSKKQPKFILCYICEKEYRFKSIMSHLQKCEAAFKYNQSLQPYYNRKPLPEPTMEFVDHLQALSELDPSSSSINQSSVQDSKESAGQSNQSILHKLNELEGLQSGRGRDLERSTGDDNRSKVMPRAKQLDRPE